MNEEWKDVNDYLNNQKKLNDELLSVTTVIAGFYKSLVEQGIPEKTAESLTLVFLQLQLQTALMPK